MISVLSLRRVALALGASGLLFAACVGLDAELTTTDFFSDLKNPGGESSESSESSETSESPSGTHSPGTSDTSAEPDCEDFPFELEDRLFRFSRVQVTEPGTLGTIIGSLVQADVRNGLLHVLVYMRDFGPYDPELEGYPFLITGNAGENVPRTEACPDPEERCTHEFVLEDARFDWFEDVEEVVYRPAVMRCDGYFYNLETLDLVFPALLPDGPLAIPLEGISIEGTLAFHDSGDVWIDNADLVGGIRETEADNIEVPIGDEPRSLSEVLSGVEQTFPEPGDNAVGWTLVANVRARVVSFHERVDLSID